MLNGTGHSYRIFDATPQTEFLYGCVQKTIEQDLPDEAEFLKRYDAFRTELNLMLDMPERLSPFCSGSCTRTAARCAAVVGKDNSRR